MLSLTIGVVAIVVSLPLGIVLALGRQSDLMIVKALCVGFIEFIRGVPLITLLFVASTLLNIFLPPGTNFDIILRVIIMATLFSAAYMAEVIRGGLAALPKGQYEGADSLGPDYWQAQRLVIMPQALKISIPGIVSSFIGLFKDTVAGVDHRPAGPAGSQSTPSGRTRTGTVSCGSFTASSHFCSSSSASACPVIPCIWSASFRLAIVKKGSRICLICKQSDREIDRSKMTVSDEVAIEITNMNKWYGAFHVLRDINLTVYQGERIVIAGPSGSGKSTLIRCLNALEEHQQGKIVVDGTELSNDLKNIDKIRSEVGMCFQHFNLFPHLTILENCTLAPIWVRKTPRKEAEETAMHFLEKVKIPDQADEIPRSAFGRSAAACGNRPFALHETADHAV